MLALALCLCRPSGALEIEQASNLNNLPNLALPNVPMLAPSAGLLALAVPYNNAPLLSMPALERENVFSAIRANPQSLKLNNVTRQVSQIKAVMAKDPSGQAVATHLNNLYSGQALKENSADGAVAVMDAPGTVSDGRFILNDEGIKLDQRAAEYYMESQRLVEKYKGKLDLSETTSVMNDSYRDVVSKVKMVEAVASKRRVTDENTHLDNSLVWVDGVLNQGKKRIAVHTYSVFFHHAKNPQSEIAEGIRRTDSYLKEIVAHFQHNGKAEQAVGPLTEVVLGFDTRGYAEIKDHIKARAADIQKRYGKRFSFVFSDEVAKVPDSDAAVRQELGRAIARYKDQGLHKIIEGVIYSRYVGLLLELKGIEHFMEQGYTILQSGRELFDADGHYITELDLVIRSPEGKVSIVEAKSARVKIPFEQVLKDKVKYKLDTYIKHRADIEKSIGVPFDDVTFVVDVGIVTALGDFLKAHEAELSKRYGVPVKFVFVENGPQQAQESTDLAR
jgi:hypothetical protein